MVQKLGVALKVQLVSVKWRHPGAYLRMPSFLSIRLLQELNFFGFSNFWKIVKAFVFLSELKRLRNAFSQKRPSCKIKFLTYLWKKMLTILWICRYTQRLLIGSPELQVHSIMQMSLFFREQILSAAIRYQRHAQEENSKTDLRLLKNITMVYRGLPTLNRSNVWITPILCISIFQKRSTNMWI